MDRKKFQKLFASLTESDEAIAKRYFVKKL